MPVVVAARWLLLSLLVLGCSGCGGAESRKAHYLERGAAFLEEANYEKARVEFRNAAQIDPKDAEARYQLGSISEKLEDFREAIAQYQAVLDGHPEHVRARAALARLYVLAGMPEKGMELAEAGLAASPDDASLLVVRGAAHVRMGNKAAALTDAQRAVELSPNDEYAVALLSSLHRDQGRIDDAVSVVRAGLEKLPRSVDLHIVLAELESGRQRLPEAEAQLKRVIELEPDASRHRFRLARFYLALKDKAAAEHVLREAVAAAPDDAAAKIALVEMLATEFSPQRAEQEIEQLIAANPDDARLRLAIAGYLEGRGQLPAAKRHYQAVIDSDAANADLLPAKARFARILLKERSLEAAKTLVDEVLQENQRDNEALLLRADMSMSRGDPAAAIADLRTILRDKPDSPILLRALAAAHLKNDEPLLAEETLRTAYQANPRDSKTGLELAQLLARSNKPDQALPILQDLAQEGDLQSSDALFRLQLAAKDFTAARATADKVQLKHPEMGVGYYLSGQVDEAQGRPQAALLAYEQALQVKPQAVEPVLAAVRVELSLSQPKAALRRVAKVIEEHNDSAAAHSLHGEVLSTLRRYDEAATAYEAAIKLSPQWWNPYRGLAIAHVNANRPAQGVAALSQGIERTGAAILRTDLAALYERTGEAGKAIEVYDAIVAGNAASSAAARSLALLLIKYRNDEANLARAAQLVDKFSASGEPEMLNVRGWVRFKQGNYREALPLLEQAVAKEPESPVLRYQLAMAQLKNGDREVARENLEKAVGSKLRFYGLDEARAALDELRGEG